ncbi:STAS domain-containing protein [Streptomyces sp. NBC_01728]|uniref:STAS domain-containing protein n=1 Tax=unclassified Streptomyces TaxID=2593676 RepID=UPI00225B9FDD|nr:MULTISPECIES: STAS domain-containing protein [unclassified Streptomyces]MCX4452320.1 STAS domain-containing protein [Streptomyces sp. NBC_01719]MCX4491680.1 STAS domain-containing protein [Streptomyces sp. NBC_01728]
MPNSPAARGPHEHHRLRVMGHRLRNVLRHPTVSVISGGDHVVLRLSGEVTFRNAEHVGERLRAALDTHPGVLEVDLGRVTYLSNDGGAASFRALLAARPHDTRVTVTHASSQARATLTQLGLDRLLDIRAESDRDGP